jgi:hypothetical protein
MTLPPFLNERLLFEPLNWLIVGVIATIWLMLFHVVMQGFTAMQSGADDKGQAPGQSPIAGPPAVGGVYEGDFALS